MELTPALPPGLAPALPGAGDEDLATLMQAAAWAAEGHGVAIATVIQAWGSAPRATGSHLAIRSDGLFAGSVSGGCVEGEVIFEAQALIEARSGVRLEAGSGVRLEAGSGAVRLDYGVADETAWRVGLACGGQISVLVQRLGADGYPAVLIAALADAARAGTSVAVLTDPEAGSSRLAGADEETPEGWLRRDWPPPRRIAIIGAVHIAQALVPLVVALGLTPLVIDPRGLFAADARFAGLALDSRWPDEALADWAPNAASAVVALTHDPKLDDVALAAALRSKAFYVAALGSRKNHAKRLERLAEQGFDAATLARIHGPAGLALGARGPAEIALSIAAELTAVWRGADVARAR